MESKCILPVKTPKLSTYHFEANACIVGSRNPTFINWIHNKCVNISCGKRFLDGFGSLRLIIDNTQYYNIPYFKKKMISAQYSRSDFKNFIEHSINQGIYVLFESVDDFYIENKTWYERRHFLHDGLIVGYDNDKSKYYIAAYDSAWVHRVFETSQKAFFEGVDAALKLDGFSKLISLKITDEVIPLNTYEIVQNLKKYIYSEKTEESLDLINGLETFKYADIYLDYLYKGKILFENTDYRIMRVIWEHKKCMLERIQVLEKEYMLSSEISSDYANLVKRSNDIRMIYSNYCITGRKNLLETIRRELSQITLEERKLILKLIEVMEKGR